ncbi:hypothetical protein [Streptomyces sp. CA-111067]|uniref:hypothetical protein n=1 Tax=Streptomyces sp. CA-111067 TaxID=3240046 RepID=UPI003D978560
MSTTSSHAAPAHRSRPAGRPDMVPFIARWSGEQDPPVAVVARGGQWTGIAYADRRAFDRDDPSSVLWTRTTSRLGKGVPQYGKVHSLRQRLCMQRLLCQICGGPADRTDQGTLWLIDARARSLLPVAEITTHPPVCLPCAHRSVRACPHLRPEWVALRVRTAVPYGVNGILYQPAHPAPVQVGTADFPFHSARLPWVLASQLIMRISDFTVTDLTP